MNASIAKKLGIFYEKAFDFKLHLCEEEHLYANFLFYILIV